MSMSMRSKIQKIIETNETKESAFRNPVLFAKEVVESGAILGVSVDSACSTARRIVEGLRPRKIVIASDFHVPFHNVRLVENFVRYVADANPDVLVIDGDFLDCESISRFPTKRGRPTIQMECDAGGEILSALADAAPLAERHLTEGNHEQRLERLLLDNPGLSDLRCLSIPELLGADDLGFTWHPYEQAVDFGRLSVIHGHYARKHSAYSAKGHLLDGGYDVVVHGHTHRLGAFWETGHRGIRRGYEIGGLFDYDQATYVRGPKNWQNGFAVAHVFGDGEAHVQLIEARPDGSFVADGRYYA
jgi:predicted phosphodiesterase